MVATELLNRREIALVLILTLIGAAVRFWGEGRLGLNHFDEGAYAITAIELTNPSAWGENIEGIIPYSPLGFPCLVAVSYLLLGISDLSAILVSQAAGILTIPLVAWLGRRAFGPGIGAAAAAFATFSGPHVAFSRMALTDATFLFTFLLAIALGASFLERPRITSAVLFGIAVGVAQNVKYNGWLAGAIVLAAVPFVHPPRGDRGRSLVRALAFGAVAAGCAALVYWPWFHYVQGTRGGYRALLAHHASYTTGWRQWLPNLRQQLDQSIALSGPMGLKLSWAGFAAALAWLCFRIVNHERDPRFIRASWSPFIIDPLIVFFVFGGVPTLLWWTGLASLPWLLHRDHPRVVVLGVWWVAFTLLTPFYHTYARLWLPLEAAGWLITSGGFAMLIARFPNSRGRLTDPVRPFITRVWIAVVVLALIHRFGMSRAIAPMPGLLGPSDSLRAAVYSLIDDKNVAGKRIRTLVRPPILFYFALKRQPAKRMQTVDGMVRGLEKGELGLIDDVLLAEQRGPAVSEIGERWHIDKITPFDLPPTTALDVWPGFVAEKKSARQSRLYLLKAR